MSRSPADDAPTQRSGFTHASGYLFVAPSLAIVFLSLILPAIATVWMSFTDISLLRPTKWIGLGNYLALWEDEHFHLAIINTVYYTVGVTIPTIIVGLAAAIVLNRPLKGRIAFRTIFYLPVLTSLIAAATVWLYMYNPQAGPVNGLLSFFGLSRQMWLQDPSLAMASIIVMAIWRDFGTAMIIYLAGLQDIPQDLYEAARLDGAKPFTIFRRITLPMLRPVTFYLVVILTVSSFQVFGAIYVMTGGGPLESTTTLVFQIYRSAFGYADFGASAAMSTVLFVMILIFSMLGSRVVNRRTA